MTVHECAIVEAYTGCVMLTGEKRIYFFQYLHKLFGRPVYTHELATRFMQDEIKRKSKPDFIKLCEGSDD